jgi:quercetin dioxygenase-like cupin family protein
MTTTATHLQALAMLTDKLPELDSFMTAVGGPVVQIASASGPRSLGFGVHRDAAVGIMRTFTPEGGSIDTHHHPDVHEWVGVIKGVAEIIFTDTGESKEVRDNEAVHIRPGRPHAMVAKRDTWTWSVSMPPAQGYPTVSGCPFAIKCPEQIP